MGMRTTEEATGTARWVRATGALITVAVLAACGSPSSSSSTSSGNSSTPARVTKTGSLTGVELAVNLKAGTGLISIHFFISSKAGSIERPECSRRREAGQWQARRDAPERKRRPAERGVAAGGRAVVREAAQQPQQEWKAVGEANCREHESGPEEVRLYDELP